MEESGVKPKRDNERDYLLPGKKFTARRISKQSPFVLLVKVDCKGGTDLEIEEGIFCEVDCCFT